MTGGGLWDVTTVKVCPCYIWAQLVAVPSGRGNLRGQILANPSQVLVKHRRVEKRAGRKEAVMFRKMERYRSLVIR